MGMDQDSDGKRTVQRVSAWAVASVCLAVLPFLLPEIRWPDYGWLLLGTLYGSCALAVVTGIIALVHIRSARGLVRGRLLAVVGIGIPLACVVFLIITAPNLDRMLYGPMNETRACQRNLEQIHEALRQYADVHAGLLPKGPAWCDEVIAETSVDPNMFCCPRLAGTPRETTYILNQHAAGKKLGELPRDFVILFEGAAGWNQLGGAESTWGGHHVVADIRHVNVLTAGARVKHWHEEHVKELRFK